MTSRSKAYIALMINTLLWGISSPVIKYGLNTVSPLYFLTFRFILVMIIITPVFILYLIKSRVKITDLKALFTIGFLSTPVNLLILFIGLQMTSALDGAVLASITPIMFAIFGHLFLKEVITRQEKAGLVVAFAGTLLFTIQPLLSKQEVGQSSLAGNLLIIAGQLIYVFALLLSKKEADKNNSFVQSYFAYLSAFVIFVPLAILTKELNLAAVAHFMANPASWTIIFMAIFGSIIGFFTYLYGQSLIEASEAAVFTYLQPLFAAPLAVFWLGEKITWPFTIGCAMIAAGVVLSETRKKII